MDLEPELVPVLQWLKWLQQLEMPEMTRTSLL